MKRGRVTTNFDASTRAIGGERCKQRVFLDVSACRPIGATRIGDRFHQAEVNVVSHAMRDLGIELGGRHHKAEANSRSLRIGQTPKKRRLLLPLILKGGAPSSRVRKR